MTFRCQLELGPYRRYGGLRRFGASCLIVSGFLLWMSTLAVYAQDIPDEPIEPPDAEVNTFHDSGMAST